jgi:hypothetical protein
MFQRAVFCPIFQFKKRLGINQFSAVSFPNKKNKKIKKNVAQKYPTLISKPTLVHLYRGDRTT